MTITYIGLGSNLGDSRQIMAEAVQKLASLGTVKISHLYQSPPMGPQDQPNYHNAVARANFYRWRSSLTPSSRPRLVDVKSSKTSRCRANRRG